MKFKLGDIVTWESQSQGSKTRKTGEVINIIQPDGVPLGYKPNGGPRGMNRDHESYVIKVKGRTYWPRVKHLKPVDNGQVK